MLDLFKQATSVALSVLGEGSLLRGSVPCNVNIEYGVQVIGYDDETVVDRTVATIDATHNPKPGDTLTHPDGTFRLDSLYKDNGTTKRFVVLKVS